MPPVVTLNADGQSPFVLLCDHASNRIPSGFNDLGLGPIERLMHIAWDPGALAVSLELVDLLDAPLVHSTVSRLVADCNRFTDSDSLMPAVSELTEIPGNRNIDAAERARRVALCWAPYHAAIERLLAQRRAAGMETILVCMHSFTPVFKGVQRPWPIGILSPVDETCSRALFEALRAEEPQMDIGWNEPYPGAAGYSYTVDHHGAGLEATMIEIRHNEILEPSQVAEWAARLARCLEAARQTLAGAPADKPKPRGGAETAGDSASP